MPCGTTGPHQQIRTANIVRQDPQKYLEILKTNGYKDRNRILRPDEAQTHSARYLDRRSFNLEIRGQVTF